MNRYMLPASVVIPVGLVVGWIAKNYAEEKEMEEIRVELKVQQRMGLEPAIKLPEHRVQQLLAERVSLLAEVQRLEAQDRERAAQRQRLVADAARDDTRL